LNEADLTRFLDWIEKSEKKRKESFASFTENFDLIQGGSRKE